MFSDHAIARGALASVLPAEVLAKIDFATLELQPASHVDEVLHAFQSDVVFSAKISGREARLVLLLEHQSSPDALMPFRLLQYAVLLWDAHLRDHPKANKLPLIIPVVWHQGRRSGERRSTCSTCSTSPRTSAPCSRATHCACASSSTMWVASAMRSCAPAR